MYKFERLLVISKQKLSVLATKMRLEHRRNGVRIIVWSSKRVCIKQVHVPIYFVWPVRGFVRTAIPTHRGDTVYRSNNCIFFWKPVLGHIHLYVYTNFTTIYESTIRRGICAVRGFVLLFAHGHAATFRFVAHSRAYPLTSTKRGAYK